MRKRESKSQKRHMHVHKIIIQTVLYVNMNFLENIHLYPDSALSDIRRRLSNVRYSKEQLVFSSLTNFTSKAVYCKTNQRRKIKYLMLIH